MHKIHLDTDLGGDLDDLCALAMLLHWPDVEITGITVVGDDRGRRTGYVRYALSLEGRNEIPVAAGADVAQGYYRYELGLPPEERYWPEPVPPSPNPVEQAVELLRASLEQGAALVGIGPYTNLSLLERRYPGILGRAKIFLMGGSIFPSRPGYPDWGYDMDFNIQADIRSSFHVLQSSDPTLVPLSVTVETSLRRAYLDKLRVSGPLCKLIADQAEEFAREYQNEERYGIPCAGLPDDTINFQHDPLACAVALGWQDGVEIQNVPLVVEEKEGWLHETIAPSGRLTHVVTSVDGPRFNEMWLNRVVM